MAHLSSRRSDAVGKDAARAAAADVRCCPGPSWPVKGLTLVRASRPQRGSSCTCSGTPTRSTEVAGEIATHGATEPFSHLTSHAMHAQAHHAKYGAAKLEEAGTASEFVTRTIKKVLDEETMRLENGLTLLATVGAPRRSSACSAPSGASTTRWSRSA
jgi:hypothetical protein